MKLPNDKITATNPLGLEEYQLNRSLEYPIWQEQLDYIYHNGVDKWKTDIVDPVKAKYPKP